MKFDKIPVGIMSAVMLLNVALFVDVLVRLYQFRWQWMDFRGQWAICAYTLRGVDPYPITGVEPPIFSDIGVIQKDWGTSPYGCLLGNVFYAGFLPLEDAKIFFFIASMSALLLTAFFLYRHFRTTQFGLLAAGFALFSYTAYGSIYSGNAGGLICCLLLICCLICDTSPIAAGVLLAFAMIKPQTALPICFALLIMKKFKPLIIAASIDLLGWLFVSIMVDRSMLGLLDEFWHADIGGGSQFSGLFTLLFIDSPKTAMLSSMIFGFAFIFVLMKKMRGGTTFDRFFPACIASAFFGYSYGNEYFLLTLPIIVIARLVLTAEARREKCFLLTALIFVSMMPIAFTYSFFFVIERGMNAVMMLWLTHTFFGVGLIFISIAMLRADFRIDRSSML